MPDKRTISEWTMNCCVNLKLLLHKKPFVKFVILDLTTLTFNDISLSAACRDALKSYVQENATLETLIHELRATAAASFIQSLYRSTNLQNLVFYGQAAAWEQCHVALEDLVRRNKSLKIHFFSRITMQKVDVLAHGLKR